MLLLQPEQHLRFLYLVDALYVVQYYNKVRYFTYDQKTAADVNKNGTVDLVDALLIMQYYNGAIKSFP